MESLALLIAENKKALGWFCQMVFEYWSGRSRFARDDPLNPIFPSGGLVQNITK
jgi:hypothetical protein